MFRKTTSWVVFIGASVVLGLDQVFSVLSVPLFYLTIAIWIFSLLYIIVYKAVKEVTSDIMEEYLIDQQIHSQ